MTGRTDNTVFITADIDLVWELTNDLSSWPQLFTEYSTVEVLDRQGSTWTFRLTMHPDPQGNVWSWVSARTLDKSNYRVSAHRVEPGWFEYMNISWSYEPRANGTVMRWEQDFSMRPDSPVNDEAMTARLNSGTTVQMAHIRDAVEQIASRRAAASTDELIFTND